MAGTSRGPRGGSSHTPHLPAGAPRATRCTDSRSLRGARPGRQLPLGRTGSDARRSDADPGRAPVTCRTVAAPRAAAPQDAVSALRSAQDGWPSRESTWVPGDGPPHRQDAVRPHREAGPPVCVADSAPEVEPLCLPPSKRAWTASGESPPAEATQGVHAWTTPTVTTKAGPRPRADRGGKTRGFPGFTQNCSCGMRSSQSHHTLVAPQSERLTCVQASRSQASSRQPGLTAYSHRALSSRYHSNSSSQ